MARPRKGWWRKAGGGWHVTFEGKQLATGNTNPNATAEEVEEAIRRAIAAFTGEGGGKREAVLNRTVGDLVTIYTGETFHRLEPPTRKSYAARLKWLVREFGGRPVSAVQPVEVEKRAAAMAWSDGTRRLTLSVSQLFFRWAGVTWTAHLPTADHRGDECVLSPDEVERVLAECRGDYGPLIRYMLLTGCRPKEARTLTVDMVNWPGGVVTLKRHKLRRKGRARVIPLSPTALAILEAQRAKYTSGYLFRGTRGQPFSEASVQERWRRIRGRLGLRDEAVPYSSRHTFANRLLDKGRSSAEVAAILGHSSSEMVDRVYGHAGRDVQRLRGIAGLADAG